MILFNNMEALGDNVFANLTKKGPTFLEGKPYYILLYLIITYHDWQTQRKLDT